ncbi:YraN family protein [uncultured Corynebacterium sp.]|uniref:YraN family protein n=1 Tax=uncultured Corynebacterium sp. TaxID=159447 RepID=UPI0025FA45AF|nr:YraN family protein [uncultured Corynebacterium sp.]
MGTDGSTQAQLRVDDDHVSAFLGSCSTQLLGQWGEDRAVEWLVRQGFAIADRNWRFHRGELDIVATMNSSVLNSPTVCAVVEVKTRRTQLFGGGVEAITRKSSRPSVGG